MIQRLIPAMLLGLGVSAFLFWLMYTMVQRHAELEARDPVTQVDFIGLKHLETPPETITRELPPAPIPDAPAAPPVPASSMTPSAPSQPAAPAFDTPKLEFSIGGGTIAAPATGYPSGSLAPPMPETGPGPREIPGIPGSGNASAELAPIVRIPPTYPMEARRQKIEGWVRMELTVLEDGSVTDVRVRSAQPAGVFDQAAMAAIAQWKFRPAVVNGKPVRKRAAQTLKFELNR